MKKAWPSAIGFALVWTIPAVWLASRFPTVFIDEAENANHAYNLAFHHAAVFSLYDNLYPPSLAMLRQSWPVVIRPFFVDPLAFYFRSVGFSFLKARLFDVGVGALALALMFGVGSRAFGRRAGFWAAAILGTRFAFLYSTHTIRPESLLCLAGIGMMACLWIGLEEEAPLWLVPAGLLAGAAGGIHTNGVWFAVPCLALPLLEKKWRAAGFAAAGTILGLCAFIHFADWERFLPGVQSLFFREFAAPPLTALHGNAFAAIAEEFQRYQGDWIFSQWRGGRWFQALAGWQLLLYVGAVCWAFTQKPAIRRLAWMASLLALAFALGVGQKAYNYTTALEPFFILPLAAWLTQEAIDPGWALLGAAGVGLLFPLGIFPIVILPAFFILRRRAAGVAILGFLLCIVTRIAILKSEIAVQPILIRELWPLMLFGAITVGILCLRRRTASFSPASLAAGVLGVVTAGTLLFVGAVAGYQPAFPELARQMSASMEPGARVAGPQELWLGLSAYDYRDIGGLMWYRLLLGQKDLLTPLAAFHPRYVIIGPSLISRLRKFNSDLQVKGLQQPTGLFPWPHRIVNVWATGPAYDGQLALIEMQWPPDPRRGKT